MKTTKQTDYRVLHFVRKKSQLKSSFIINQIINHINFIPSIAYKFEKYKEGHERIEWSFDKEIEELNLSLSENKWDKILFKFLKKITRKQATIIKEYIEKRKINILHFHYGTDAGMFLLMLKRVNLLKVVSFYGYDCSDFPNLYFGLAKYYLQKRTFKYADKVFAMSKDMQDDLIKLGCPKDKIIVHYFGSDIQKFYSIHNYNKKRVVSFLNLSRFIAKKGHDFLLKAFSLAYKKNQNIHLTIVGDGITRDLIYAIIDKFGMQKYVTVKSSYSYASEEHLRYLSNADIFIHPSLIDKNGEKEGIPGAVIEAMASGLPVISTYHAGIPEIIKNYETGLLVEEWDVDKLTEYILELSSKADMRKQIGEAGQKSVMSTLKLEDKEKELEEIYTNLIEK